MLCMIGRTAERALIEALLTGARAGRSGSLVLAGEPGVGKSVLLAHAVGQAADLRVLRATGVENEISLGFAGLDQLLRPVLHLVERLPAPQADALFAALGRGGRSGQDPFLVSLAVLSLLSEAAEDRPVLCVVDDAHWVDRPSADALAFTARRLAVEGVVVLAATREEPWPGLPTVPVERFGPDDAAELLHQQVGPLAPDVRDRLIEETGGNPLALAEFAADLSPAELAGRKPLPGRLRLTARIQDAFLARASQLSEASQTLLLIAAADDTADPTVVLRAAADMGVASQAFAEVERSRLATVDGNSVVFRHPLVRAAVYQAATFPVRVAVHRALAGALHGDDHTERRVWHLAATATGPDEQIAGELERAGVRARRRGGFAVAAKAFERAAELSAAQSDRAGHLVAAAHAALQAGQADRGAKLLDLAMPLLTEDQRAGPEVSLLRGRIQFARGSSVDAHVLLMTAANGMAGKDPRAAAAVALEARRAAWNAFDAGRLAEATDLLAGLPLPDGDPLRPIISTAVATNDLAAGRVTSAVARMRQATAAMLELAQSRDKPSFDSGFVMALLAGLGATRVTGDDEAAATLGGWVVGECRTRGWASWLPWALVNLSMSEILAGRIAAATANATEALMLARDLGQANTACSGESVLALLAAVRGDVDECRQLADSAVRLSEAHELHAIGVVANWARGVLELSLGRPEQALDRLLNHPPGPLAAAHIWSLIVPDLVESAVQAGRPEGLGKYVTWYTRWASSTGQIWAEAAVHRCRAMLAGADPEGEFTRALRLYERAGPGARPLERARTQLLYGQWLRRARRRGDARIQLRAAHETFQRLGARPWADRAGRELRAGGEAVRGREPSIARLTPQETQVVRLVAEGRSNQDVAARLFLSPRTVAYHLYKAYPKLGVSSRTELAGLDLDALLESG